MSHVYYDEEWRKTQDLLSSTLQGEIAQADRRENRKSLATLYVQYILVANRLSGNVLITIKSFAESCLETDDTL